jgi:putative DNA primase/helicase
VGLNPPKVVLAATQEWKDESDPLAPFIEECCVLVPGARAGATPLYERYKQWAQTNGIKDYMNQKGFGTRLRKQFPVEPGRNVRYVNIGLKNNDAGDIGGPEV